MLFNELEQALIRTEFTLAAEIPTWAFEGSFHRPETLRNFMPKTYELCEQFLSCANGMGGKTLPNCRLGGVRGLFDLTNLMPPNPLIHSNVIPPVPYKLTLSERLFVEKLRAQHTIRNLGPLSKRFGTGLLNNGTKVLFFADLPLRTLAHGMNGDDLPEASAQAVLEFGVDLAFYSALAKVNPKLAMAVGLMELGQFLPDVSYENDISPHLNKAGKDLQEGNIGGHLMNQNAADIYARMRLAKTILNLPREGLDWVTKKIDEVCPKLLPSIAQAIRNAGEISKQQVQLELLSNPFISDPKVCR